MEKQIISIRITTEGDKCEMSTEEIKAWYEKNIKNIFNLAYGTPTIEVSVERFEA